MTITERMKLFDVVPEGYQAVRVLEKYVRANVDHTVLELVKVRASILNGCSFCLDMHTRDALAAGESQRRLFAVGAWREAPFFDERERAALALTDAVTRLGDHGVPDDVWDQARAVWSEEETANLILAISVINVWNRLAVTTRLQPPVEVKS
jgi:AhpD family alkylhydroperoxidase